MIRGRRPAVFLLGLLGAAPGATLCPQQPPPLSVEEAVRLALEHSPRLASSREEVAQAAGSSREATAQRWPRLAVEGTVFRFEEPMIVAPLHRFDITRLPRFDQTLVQGSVGFGYTVFDGGIRGGRIGQARALEEAAVSQARSVEQRVIAAAVEAYAEVVSSVEGLRAQESRVRALVAERERVGRFLVEGRAARVEELRVDAALARARADSSTAAARLEVAEASLARLLGAPRERTSAPVLLPIRLVTRTPLDRTMLGRSAADANPVIRAALDRVAAAEAGLRAARAEWFPTIRLEARAISYGASEGSYTTEWQAGVRVAYPLFSGGSRTGAIQRARAAARQAEADLRMVEEALANELDQAVARAVDAGRRAEALRAAVAHQGEVVRTEALALSEGAGVQSDYLRAEAELAAVRAELAAAGSAEIVAQVELARLAGRLASDILGTIVESVR